MKKAKWFVFVLPLALSFSIIEGDLAYRALRLAVTNALHRIHKGCVDPEESIRQARRSATKDRFK